MTCPSTIKLHKIEGSKKKERIFKGSEVIISDKVHQKLIEQNDKKDADEQQNKFRKVEVKEAQQRGEFGKRKSDYPDMKKTKKKTAEILYSS
ncbi:hypothetical protein JTB14_005784 [Gonioctena quinquepunctata]|nr:hypothetical protein JTB14_005784 [Gonioctena quinquepunctata]